METPHPPIAAATKPKLSSLKAAVEQALIRPIIVQVTKISMRFVPAATLSSVAF
jgi:hypothetical protein